MERIERLLAPHPRLRAARPGRPALDGRCILYWMQRAQRGVDNGALNLAIAAGNALNLRVLAAFALTADYPGPIGGITVSCSKGSSIARRTWTAAESGSSCAWDIPTRSSRPWPRNAVPRWS
jgi:hypothetical protein